MVTFNLIQLLATEAMFCLAFGAVGLWAGYRLGYLEGFVASMNHDAMRGLNASQDQEGGNV